MEQKLISWNVNGLRACESKGFSEFVRAQQPDVICVQETNLQAGQIALPLSDYHQYWNYAEKKGYSGTAILTREKPLEVFNGIGVSDHDREGRVLTAEYNDYYLVTVYTPNSQRELARLAYRMEWEDAFLKYLKGLENRKPVICCGDMNVAHQEIDLKNPGTNHKNAGFTDEEREKFGRLLDSGFVDTFRLFYPDKEGAYTWWSYRFHAREKNAGWRIDYFLASGALRERLKDALIYTDVTGSDHCPVGLVLE